MVKEFTKERTLINRELPFMVNFPFENDFDVVIESSPVMAVMFDEEFDQRPRRSSKMITFRHKGSPLKTAIAITTAEMSWLKEKSDNIKRLDKIAKRIDRGLKTKDLLLKRDISIEADEWLSQLADSRSSLSKETYNDVLINLLDSKTINQTVKFVNDLNKLYSRKGLIKMSKHDVDVTFTFLHFRLIYAKLILGIVIASKISI